MEEMLDIIVNGPNSCMSGDEEGFAYLNDKHPYEAYDPKFGWHMACVMEGGVYTGRALLNEQVYVRTYRKRDSGSYSDSDERLNAWLQEEGYCKASCWSGYKISKLAARNSNGFVAPYLDGDHKYVIDNRTSLTITDDESEADYQCDNTDGTADEVNKVSCEDCGDRIADGDGHWVYSDESTHVCEHCRDNHYQHVIGRRGNEYAVREEVAIEVNGDYYDPEYLSDNGIVELHNGEYIHEDDAVYIESCGEYFENDDSDICYTIDGEWEMREDCVELENGEYCLESESWLCEHSEDWYQSSECDSVTTACGKIVHEDYADLYDLEDEDEDETTQKKESNE
jgi:hypothetical protein